MEKTARQIAKEQLHNPTKWEQYINEKLHLGIYESNIVGVVERFTELDKGDREVLLHDIGLELEEIRKYFIEKTNA